MALTFLSIEPEHGNAALLQNQPIIQGCKVATSDLQVGDVVKLKSNGEIITVEKAGNDDMPFGVVARCSVKTSFAVGEYVSIFPTGCFVYLKADDDLTSGDLVGCDIKPVATSNKGVLGIACNTVSEGDLAIVQIKPSIFEQNLASKQANLNLDSTLAFTDTDMYAWEGEIAGKEIVYTSAETPSATGNKVYYYENGKYEILVSDATYASSKLTITLAGHNYDYERSSENDRQDAFLGVVQ